MLHVPSCSECGGSQVKFYRVLMRNGLEHCKMVCVCGRAKYVAKELLCIAEPGIVRTQKYLKEEKLKELNKLPNLFDYGNN